MYFLGVAQLNAIANNKREDLQAFISSFCKNIEVCKEEVKSIQHDLLNKETRFVLLDPPPTDSATPPIDSATPLINTTVPPPAVNATLPNSSTMPYHFVNSMEIFKECAKENENSPSGQSAESRNFAYIPNFTAAGNIPASEMPQPMFGFCSPQIPNYVSPQFPPPIPPHVHNPVFMASNQAHPMQAPFNTSVYPNANNVFHPVGVGYPPGYMPVIQRGNYAPTRVLSMNETMRPPNVTVTNSHAHATLTGVRNPKQTSRDTSKKVTFPLSTFTSVANPQTPPISSVNTSDSIFQNINQSDDRLPRDEVGNAAHPIHVSPLIHNNPIPTINTDVTAEVQRPQS